MKKLQIIILLLLVIVVGLLGYVKWGNEGLIRAGATQSLDKGMIEPQLEIDFLDIGQGDATFITFPDGRQMLVDCAIDARILEALGRVMPFYDTSIDYLVVTHPDRDHYGGCIDVMKRYEIADVMLNGFEKPYDDYWQEFDAVATEEGSHGTLETVDHERTWDIAGATVHFLYPDHSIQDDPKIPGTTKEADANNTSVVLKISFDGVDILLMGDAEVEEETYLTTTYGDQIDVEVLKAGHHGSAGSSSQLFVNRVSPLHTIFSAGKENTYGHPSLRVIRRVERLDSHIWRTDEQGDIILKVTHGMININKQQFPFFEVTPTPSSTLDVVTTTKETA